MITALCIVSASEIAVGYPDFTYDLIETNRDKFLKILYDLGMDTSQQIEIQPDIQHRNRLDKIVICDRYVGHERTDLEWINSGYASQEAKDKRSGNRLIQDLYKQRGHI